MAIYDQKCKLSKRTNRQISLALYLLPTVVYVKDSMQLSRREDETRGATKRCLESLYLLIVSLQTTKSCFVEKSLFQDEFLTQLMEQFLKRFLELVNPSPLPSRP
jgi:hypothetical protein